MNKKRSTFTLVEMLTVMAVIAVLVLFLMPSLRNALEGSRRTSCMNNLRQLGLGIANYAEDNYGFTFHANQHSDTSLIYKGDPILKSTLPHFAGWNSTGILLSPKFAYITDQLLYRCPSVTRPGQYGYQQFAPESVEDPPYYWGSDYRHRICNVEYGPFKMGRKSVVKKALEADNPIEAAAGYQQRPYHGDNLYNVLYTDMSVFATVAPSAGSAWNAAWGGENWFRNYADRR